jgi:hypothetical protein
MSEATTWGREHWLDIRNYHEGWASRARFAARHIPHRWVSDIGCGKQALSKYLRPGAIYLPSDMKAWDDNVETCDLNEGQLPTKSLSLADVAVLLGVIERIVDLPTLFASLARATEHLVVSYHPIEKRPTFSGVDVWCHQYSAQEITVMLRAAGYDEITTRAFKEQTIWYARSKSFTREQREARSKVRAGYAGPRPSLGRRFRRLFGL